MRPSPQGTLTQFEKPRGPGAQRRPRDLPRPLLSDMGFILLLGESASSARPQWRLRPGLPGQGYRPSRGLQPQVGSLQSARAALLGERICDRWVFDLDQKCPDAATVCAGKRRVPWCVLAPGTRTSREGVSPR